MLCCAEWSGSCRASPGLDEPHPCKLLSRGCFSSQLLAEWPAGCSENGAIPAVSRGPRFCCCGATRTRTLAAAPAALATEGMQSGRGWGEDGEIGPRVCAVWRVGGFFWGDRVIHPLRIRGRKTCRSHNQRDWKDDCRAPCATPHSHHGPLSARHGVCCAESEDGGLREETLAISLTPVRCPHCCAADATQL